MIELRIGVMRLIRIVMYRKVEGKMCEIDWGNKNWEGSHMSKESRDKIHIAIKT